MMQKLLRRSPPFPQLFSAVTPPPPLTTNPYTKNHSLLLGFIRGFQSLSFSTYSLYSLPPPPAMSSFYDIRSVLNISGYSLHLTTKLTDAPLRIYFTNCRMCSCALTNEKPPSASVFLMKDRTTVRSASYHTSSHEEIKSVDSLGAVDDDEHLQKEGEALSSGEMSVEDWESNEKLVSLDSSSEEKPLRSNRKQKSYSNSASAAAAAPPENPNLLTIPGVGPRNLKKLVKKGIEEVSQLKQLYRDKFCGKSNEKMVEYLRSFVGIIHRNHAESITTYIKKCVDEELDGSSNSNVKAAQKNRLTFCVEGNISVGKTTFLQRIANETLELRDLVEIVPEPINKWQDIGPDHFNILDAFYAEPQRYAYTFQNYVFVTRVMQERESSGGVKPLRLLERSVFSDRMVFVRAVHEANWMNEMEISIYDSWFDPVVSTLPGLIPDGFIYLRATPDTCHKRMMLRKRTEEGGVSLDYLQGLHEKHESWLFPSQAGSHGILSVTKLPIHLDTSLHPDIRDRVFYLEGEHMHSSIQKVPALVLDCEPNIDFNKDIEAKRQYARQVAEFFAFVKKRNEAVSPKVENAGASKSMQPQVFVPHKGLWVPSEGTPSLNFRRHMSLMSS